MSDPVQQTPPDDEAAPKLGAVLDFMRLVWGVDHALQRRSKRMNSELGVTGPQRLVVRVIGKYPGVSAGRIADILHLDKSTLSGVLQRLETRGLVVRRADQSDGRRAEFRLTAKGRVLDGAKHGTVEAAARRALARTTPTQLAAASLVLEALATELLREEKLRPRRAAKKTNDR